jgi:hypothetical protein
MFKLPMLALLPCFLSCGTALHASRLTLRPIDGADLSAISQKTPEETSFEQPDLILSPKGPWGQLEYFETYIQAPEDLVLATQPRSIRTRWFFGGVQEEDLKELLKQLELPQDLATALCAPDSWSVEPEGITLFPSIEQIQQVPNPVRAKLYSTLSKWDKNFYHVEPEIIYADSVRAWLKGYDISETTISFAEKVSYKLGTTMLFADTPAILELAGSEKERLEILRAISRSPALVATVLLDEEHKIDAQSYWSKGFSAMNTSPFREAMNRLKAPARIDLIHLLPANVRKLLYTYHNPKTSISGYLPDCHWSALNFFNADPFDHLCEPSKATAYAIANFTPVAPPYEFGDVLFFTDTQSGDAYHSCVYIAADIVFTKNGRSPLEPWVLLKLDKVKSMYDMHFNTNVTAYRRKPGS